MTHKEAIAWWCIGGIAVAFLSWFTMSPGVPTIYAPFNLLVLVPAFRAGMLIDGIQTGLTERAAMNVGVCLGVAIVPLVFCGWTLPLLRGCVAVHRRSVILFICTLVGSALWIAFGYRDGIRYEGSGYMIGVILVSIVCWVSLGALALVARRRASPRLSFAFHILWFAWLAWYSFPFLGEFQ
jgi:hypothetical protein